MTEVEDILDASLLAHERIEQLERELAIMEDKYEHALTVNRQVVSSRQESEKDRDRLAAKLKIAEEAICRHVTYVLGLETK